jgi:hypothetical protein
VNATTVKAVASLAPVAGLIYTVSHFGTVTTIALGLTVGAAVWVRAKAKGSPAAAPEQPAAAGPSAAEQIVAGTSSPACARRSDLTVRPTSTAGWGAP